MCYAILRVSYKNGTEPVTLKELDGPAELSNAVAELKGKSGVQKITTYFPFLTVELISTWTEHQHGIEEGVS